MKIAICDDEREFLKNVGLAIETYLNEKDWSTILIYIIQVRQSWNYARI